MKKRAIIIISVILVLTALGIWQRNNIKAVYLFFKYDKAGVEKLLEENKKALEETVKQYGDYVPRGLTAEEEERIASGEMSIEEATEMLISETENMEAEGTSENMSTEKSETGAEVKPETTAGNKVDTKKKEGEIIKNYTAKFYSMKAYYIGQLSGIEASARKEYSSMSADEKKKMSKANFVSKYMGYATTLQGECDAEVSSLLKSMKEELKAIGADTSIIGVIQQAYENEKAARKAYYMNMVS